MANNYINLTEKPFLRRAKLTFALMDGSTVVIDSDGTRGTLRMGFTVHKSINGNPNSSTFTIYNLSKKTRDSLNQNFSGVQLEVAWETSTLHVIYIGQTLSCITTREGADYVTRITAVTNIKNQSLTPIAKTYGEGMPLKSVLKDVAGRFQDVKIDDNKIKVDGSINYGGFTTAGLAKDCLDNLANLYGFNWSIQDGVFQAVPDTFTGFANATVVSYKNGTLFSVTPILMTSMQLISGITVNALLIPTVFPGDVINVESEVNSQLDGAWYVHTIESSGDLCTNEWRMTIQCFKNNFESPVGSPL